jgi:hypothetical protein
MVQGRRPSLEGQVGTADRLGQRAWFQETIAKYPRTAMAGASRPAGPGARRAPGRAVRRQGTCGAGLPTPGRKSRPAPWWISSGPANAEPSGPSAPAPLTTPLDCAADFDAQATLATLRDMRVGDSRHSPAPSLPTMYYLSMRLWRLAWGHGKASSGSHPPSGARWAITGRGKTISSLCTRWRPARMAGNRWPGSG